MSECITEAQLEIIIIIPSIPLALIFTEKYSLLWTSAHVGYSQPRTVIKDTLVQSLAILCWSCVEQSGKGTDFSKYFQFSPVSIIPLMLHIHLSSLLFNLNNDATL
jgi:hypothetical protein